MKRTYNNGTVRKKAIGKRTYRLPSGETETLKQREERLESEKKTKLKVKNKDKDNPNTKKGK